MASKSQFYIGWFLAAPVRYRPADNYMVSRRPGLEWRMVLNLAASALWVFARTLVDWDWAPKYSVRITDPDWPEGGC